MAIQRKNLFLLFYLLIIVAVFFSKAALSIITGILLLLSLFTYETDGKLSFGLNKLIFSKSHWSTVGFTFIGFLCYFFWIVLSGLWSDNTVTYSTEITGKLAYIIIPLMMIFSSELSLKDIHILHDFLLAIVGFCFILVLLAYIPHFEEVNEAISHGKAIPTPIDHVRFSMITSYTILAQLAFLLVYPATIAFKTIRWIIVCILIILLHVLAVRTGIALFYAGLVILSVYIILQKKAYQIGLGLLVPIVILPVLAYFMFPSIQQKIQYSTFDWETIQEGNGVGKNYSDSDRIYSITNGLKVWRQSWLTGVGAGDYYDQMIEEYKSLGPKAKKLLPHNQFVRTGMGYGIIGNILLLFAMLIPFYKKANRHNILLILLIGIYLLSFLVEANLERYYIMMFFFYFLGWNLQAHTKDLA